MRIEALADADAVARAGAALTAEEARAAVAARGRFVVAFSGGRTPWTMLRALADEKMPWPRRARGPGRRARGPSRGPDRNLTHLRDSLLAHCPLRPEQVHAMPVESTDLEAASSQYAQTLRDLAATRSCSISFIWAWDPTGIPRRWSRAIRCSTSSTGTSRSAASIRGGAG
jgi:6-phosphogluconolactonase/glucosamine-6-phosphate isomerase/deaminase